MKFSRFSKVIKIEDAFCYINSLSLVPVYLSKKEHEELQRAVALNYKPIGISKNDYEALKRYYILVDDNKTDANLLSFVQSKIPEPHISIAYFVLTEQCNLACKYCFLGNGQKRKLVTNYPMSEETAQQALEYFFRNAVKDGDSKDPLEIIFYGGEPLINYKVMKYIISQCRNYYNMSKIPKIPTYSMVTNGVLLNTNIANFLKENDVSVSISLDGATLASNSSRVNKSGRQAYEQIMRSIELADIVGLRYGLSITLTKNTLSELNELVKFVEKRHIQSVSFNILHQMQNFKLDKEYYVKATKFIIGFYERTKDKGIYEDRIMRKINAFMQGELYYSDCAATSGSQIVITPDGGVGICHGCMENREYFISNIHSKENINQNDELKNWIKFSPLFKKECLSCEALGICGGGCPINARNLSRNHSLMSRDSAFCIHSKLVLKFILKKVYELCKENSNS